MKKLFVLLILMIVLSSCNEKIDNNYSFSEIDVSNNEYVKSIDSYNSDVTSCYKDKNGLKHLFIYSNPIRYFNGVEYENINIKIKENQYKGYKNEYKYIYENNYSASLFPRDINKNGLMICNDIDLEYSFKNIRWNENFNKVEFINFIGKKVEALKYSSEKGIDLYTYPSAFGIENEFVIKEPNILSKLKLSLKCKEAKKDRECIQIKNDSGETSNIVQNLLIKDNSIEPKITSSVSLNFSQEDMYFLAKYSFDKKFMNRKNLKYPLRLYLPINYVAGSLPDKSVYSNKNASYLDNYFIIGNEKNLGFGKCYKRFVINDLVKLDAKRIVKVNFYMYSLSNISKIEAKEVLEDWCSITTNWGNDIKTGEYVFKKKDIPYGEFVMDITKQCKSWLEDPTKHKERNGVVISSKSNQPMYILSNDNTLYNSKVEIIFK